MKITIIGTGYVGLVTGTCFAESGHEVVCVDRDEQKIARLLDGEVPIYEPGLEELIRRNTTDGRLQFTTNLNEAISGAKIAFIAVGTPQAHDGSADLSAVRVVAQQIGEAMDGELIVVNKSTVPVGTAKMVEGILRETAKHTFHVVSNPEFLKEGAAIEDFMRPDRVVIGTDNDDVAETMRHLYSPFLRTGKPLIVMDAPSAEMTKYASNALLATKISFMNEIARLCTQVGADVSKVRNGVGADSRIGYPFLFPGVGYGGSCFPKDVRAICTLAKENGGTLEILEKVDEVNEKQKEYLVEQVVRRFGEDLSGHTFAVWGLSFKPRTDDMREAPSIVIINALTKMGAKVRAHDPEAREAAAPLFGEGVELVSQPYEACDGASALLLVTEWNEFRRPDFERVQGLLQSPVVFDGRNIWNGAKLQSQGFEYYGIGVRDSSYE